MSVVEGVYTLIEICVMMFFITMYFKPKPLFSRIKDFSLSFLALVILEVGTSALNLHWLMTMIVSCLVMLLICSLFYKGTLTEHIIISFISVFLLAMSDVCAFTMIVKFLGVKYNELADNNTFSRLLAVLCSKALYLIAVSCILFFKKKYKFFMSKGELILMLITLIISSIEITLLRNIIYSSKSYYNLFLTILLCVVFMNIILFYTMVYIGKKNIAEKNYSLLQKQLELQEESLKTLERKYDETAKIRHDFKNYISCALKMLEEGNDKELTNYLEDLSEKKINEITSYVATKRAILGAVINSKLSQAKNNGIEMQCYILSELENIPDIDIGILLANIIDNALEACEKNDADSEVILKTWSEAGYYSIELTNTVEKDVLAENPKLITSKEKSEFHGVGLKSVKDIVNKYDGMISFDQKGNVFRVFISLVKETS